MVKCDKCGKKFENWDSHSGYIDAFSVDDGWFCKKCYAKIRIKSMKGIK